MMRYTPSCHVLLVLAVAACRIVVGPGGGGGLLLVHAGLPAVDVGVTLNDTSIASLEDLKSDLLQSFQPGATWSQEARLLGCDVTVGGVVKDFAKSDGPVPDYSLFGTLKGSVLGRMIQLNGRADADCSSSKFDRITASLQAQASPRLGGTTVKVDGAVDTKTQAVTIRSVGVDQPLLPWMGGGRGGTGPIGLSLNFNVPQQQADVLVRYAHEGSNTAFTLGGTAETQSVTLSKTFVARGVKKGTTVLAPTLTSDGDFELAFQTDVGLDEGAVLSGNYVPDSSLTLKYREDPFSASLVVPVDGFYTPLEGTKLSLKMSL